MLADQVDPARRANDTDLGAALAGTGLGIDERIDERVRPEIMPDGERAVQADQGDSMPAPPSESRSTSSAS